jgi:hypothetical protein
LTGGRQGLHRVSTNPANQSLIPSWNAGFYVHFGSHMIGGDHSRIEPHLADQSINAVLSTEAVSRVDDLPVVA